MQNTEKDVSNLGVIVSKTDLNGTILEVNDAFVIASGYSKQELIGQPHNIVRHPDVPKAVFADMWMTLKAGSPWVQIVKNRCKDGSYYWVEANVTPVLEKGKIVGYLSIRKPVSNEIKQSASTLYKEIDSGRKSIRYGYIRDGFQRLCVFDKIHPINLMITMVAILGVILVGEVSGLLNLSIEIAIAISLFFIGYSYAGRQYAFSRLGKAKIVIDKMREGDFSGQVNYYGNHSLSRLISSVKMMQVQLGASYVDAQEKLKISMRLKSALDNASSCVMMVNHHGEVIYVNKQLHTFFETNIDEVRKSSQSFDLSKLIGCKLNSICPNVFFKDLSQMKQSEEEIGLLKVQLSVIPVKDSDGISIGSIIEWQDMTQQRLIEQELQSTLRMASTGHTALHIDTGNLSGFYLDTSNNVNSLLEELNAIIESMVFVMTKLAIGDIRGRVEKDLQGSLAAMKGATNVSLDNLSAIVLHIKRAAETVGLAAEESSKAALDLSDRTQQAAAALEEINASMTNMSDLQHENTAELTAVNDTAHLTVDDNKVAKESLEATVSSIQQIQKTSEEIANIITIIDGIAFQTNLLALNAAVEAARAGEHGRGFAVVAGEVRTLAQKSAEAAKDIKGLIDSSVNKVNEGVSKVYETQKAFESVDERVSNIGQAMKIVLASIQEQQHSVSEIALAISNLDSNIQSNAALVEESSSAAVSLKEQAVLLNAETSKFVINESEAEKLIQHSNEVYGVKLSDIRQNMRVWRSSVQTFLNGIPTSLELESAINPSACGVGKSLATIISRAPEISNFPEYRKVDDLHIRQHELVKEAIEIMDSHSVLSIDELKEKDIILDEFVKVTDQLDIALSDLNSAIVHHAQ
ncbi:methyl-accepting chemotaxis protein [Thiomicrorhabdus sp.]|uniref:methyl-accepting chemotaxis protein n=1 Tax=Thiomicrorhabdus sp. TaxID=2039724 RepID=UPI002AA9300E|nr:methyl-accepting chemotaxis protein [Thiomicrorhabdus sp.]